MATTAPIRRRRRRPLVRWLVVLPLKLLVGFVVISVLWVLLYRFVNPPITFTQLGDAIGGNGVTRQWMPIERIDRDMVRAVIAGEDSKFCTHNGFDRQAIEAAMRRNAQGGGVIPVYEDGHIVRDFVFVDDVVAALLAGLDARVASENPWDIGSGTPTTILEIARLVAGHYGAPEPKVTGGFRLGDVRHASCEIQVVRDELGWAPQVGLEDGIRRLCEWLDREVS